MTMLSQVTRGKIKRPLFMVIYGVDGVGKSSLAAGADSPLFFGPERGTDHLEVSRAPQPKSWADVEAGIGELLSARHDYKTLVLDTIDWIEPLLHASVAASAGKSSIEDIPYGKGPLYALEIWSKFIASLEELRDRKKMNILALGHSELARFVDVSNEHQEYERYGLKMNKKSAAKWREAADAVLFAHYITQKTVDPKDRKTRIKGGTLRVLHTQRAAGWDAKNRYGLPSQIILSETPWADLQRAIDRAQNETAAEAYSRLTSELEGVLDPEKRIAVAQYLEANKTNAVILKSISARLAEILELQEET